MKWIEILKHQEKIKTKGIKITKTKKKTISIIGASRKLGVTHICLSLANFLHSALKREVLYIELAEESQLLSTVGEKQINFDGTVGFVFKGVTYILACDVEKALKLLNSHSGYIIVDIHNYDEKTKCIFERCDKRIVIGSMKPWCRRDLDILLSKMKGVDDMGMNFYNKTTLKKENADFEKEFHRTMKTLPIIDNPFLIKEKEFKPLLEMLM